MDENLYNYYLAVAGPFIKPDLTICHPAVVIISTIPSVFGSKLCWVLQKFPSCS